ncbi:VTT domain-containing protein [Rossellomorea aquimaris]|uniref:VTT domain-containing protein n=1 Tax=Rossellomorea aquimaris TaxID=189382 RepID=UPI001CD3477D|nr:VTT domain-containing protein [Rossellomorea aquimaris]MCA1055988.1 VTT domain-containing protein [Rossellomorea aquimaris]
MTIPSENRGLLVPFHLLLAAACVCSLQFLMPTLNPIVRQSMIVLTASAMIVNGFFTFTKNEGIRKGSRLVLYTILLMGMTVTLIYYISMLNVAIETSGFETFLRNHEASAKIIYLLICFFQPILLPIPEAVTVPAGSAVFGVQSTIYLSFLGTTAGIIVMFLIARTGGQKLALKLVKEKLLMNYQAYTKKNESITLFLLFILPILPDEIICAGAGIGRVSVKKFLLISSLSKMATSTLLAYSIPAAEALSLSSSQFVLAVSLLLALILGVSTIGKKRWIKGKSRLE